MNINERLFLLDCAEGTQIQLRKYKIHFQRIRHIFITHLHGDHFYGLIGFLTTLLLLGRKEEMHIYSPPLLEEIIGLQLEASQTRLLFPVTFHPVTGAGLQTLFEDDRVLVQTFPLVHSVPTYGYLFREKIKVRKAEEKRSYAYCTDTVYDERILPYIMNVNLLYHESTFMQDMKKAAHEKLHSTAFEAATIALNGRVKKLLIGHFSARYEDLQPMLDEARSVFSETYLAEDGVTFSI